MEHGECGFEIFGKMKISEIEITFWVLQEKMLSYNVLKFNKYFLFEEFGGRELTIDFLKLKGKKEKYFNPIFLPLRFDFVLVGYGESQNIKTLSFPISSRIRNII